MNFWEKMFMALRGGVNEVGEVVVDSQALRILDQEVRDAADELKQSKASLVGILAKQKVAEEKSSQYKTSIEEYEGYAKKALEKADRNLALEIAEKISDYEHQLSVEIQHADEYRKNATDLQKAIRLAEKNIKRLKQQIDMVKATENVQRAQAAVAERYTGTNVRLRTAMDSLERIKERQAEKAARLQAAAEIAEETGRDSLKKKLEKAGIVPSTSNAEDILARITEGRL